MIVGSNPFLIKAVEQVNPVKRYANLKDDRLLAFKENTGKTGVYCLINLTNGHNYIGSSINLKNRIQSYLNNSYLNNVKNANMPIIKALFKYGQNNFAILIVEYTETEAVNKRETHWIKNLSPYYNVLQEGYSSVGYKHSEVTKELLSLLAKNRTHSDETKFWISKSLTGVNNPFYGKSHSAESKLKMIKANSAHPVYVYNSRKQLLLIYPSGLTLAKAINSNLPSIVSYINTQSLFRGEWYFCRIPLGLSDIPLIFDYTSTEGRNVELEIQNSSHIRKAVFLYDLNQNFICKYDGVMSASKELKISHNTIKKCLLLNIPYKKYIFSYNKLI